MITYYEIERGLLAVQADRKLATFALIAANSRLISLNMPILRRAAQLWAYASQNGLPRGDVDILIAATAMELDLALITGNHRHFDWITDLRLEVWA